MEHNVKIYCPHCSELMEQTGLPDIAGDIDFRFFRCPNHGLIKVKAKEWKEQVFKEPSKDQNNLQTGTLRIETLQSNLDGLSCF